MSRWLWAIFVFGLLPGSGCRPGGVSPVATAPVAASPMAAMPLRAVSTATGDLPSDGEFWRLSRDAVVVAAGRAAFNSSSCRTCHAVALTGGPGPNLIDQRWLYGGTPREVFRTITRGVQSKGMPEWGPVLGPAMITDIVAFIFSFHREGEPVELQASFTPFTPAYE